MLNLTAYILTKEIHHTLSVCTTCKSILYYYVIIQNRGSCNMPLMCDGYTYFFVVLYMYYIFLPKKSISLCTKYVVDKGLKKCKVLEYVLKCLNAYWLVTFSHENIVKTI